MTKKTHLIAPIAVVALALLFYPFTPVVLAAEPYLGCGLEGVSINPSSITDTVTTQVTVCIEFDTDCVVVQGHGMNSSEYGATWGYAGFTRSGSPTSDGATTSDTWNLNNAPNGTYTFTVTALGYGHGCYTLCPTDQQSATLIINRPAVPTCTISTFTGSSDTSFKLVWSVSGVSASSIRITQNSGGSFSPNPYSPVSLTGTLSNVHVGQYTLSSTDAGCTSVASVTAPLPALTATWQSNGSHTQTLNITSGQTTDTENFNYTNTGGGILNNFACFASKGSFAGNIVPSCSN